METILIIVILLICCCCSSSLGGLFYKPKFNRIGGGMNSNENIGDIKKLECSDDAFITKVYGAYEDDNINYFGIKCSDDKSPDPIGINKGSPFSSDSKDGFNKIDFKGHNSLEYVKIYPITGTEKEFGKFKAELWEKGEKGPILIPYFENSFMCRKNEKLLSTNLFLNKTDNTKLGGGNDWSCGTDQSLFEAYFK